jgi:ATP-dependent DNA helicase RecQ
VLRDGSTWRRTPVKYALDRERIEGVTSQRELEWCELQEYVDTTECLMLFLARALDDPQPQPCGICSNCLGHDVISRDYPHDLAVQATRFLRQAEFPLEPRKQVPPDAFVHDGLTSSLLRQLGPETGRVLSTWNDAGWGHIVKDDKHTEHFRDELADAVVAMVTERWRPDPEPTWVTCVPSLNHPQLVPDLARRIADRLQLPFVDAVRKVRSNEPQKRQENAYHQCANLDGVFEVSGHVPAGPVLLLDDVVDSRWTLNVVATLLRRAGAQAVWPVALASASPD